MLKPVRMCRLDCVVPEDFKVGLIGALDKEGITQIELFSDGNISRGRN